jgi:manganese/iron transport system permease protein
VGTLLVIALLIVPAATARLFSHRLPLMVPLACGLAGVAAWTGLEISYRASVLYGWRLASGATVVLVIVACYALALALNRLRKDKQHE